MTDQKVDFSLESFDSENNDFKFSINELAKNYLVQIASAPFLRVSVKKGGCSGLMYNITQDHAFDLENDYKIDFSENLSLLVNQNEAKNIFKTLFCIGVESLNGLIIKWSHQASGLVCGCGESFE